MDKFLDIIKIFLEKHFLPALTAIVLAGITFYFTPDDFAFSLKLGKPLYILVAFSFSMLVVEIFCKLINSIKTIIHSAKEQAKRNEHIAKQNEEYLLDMIDSLTPENRRKIDYFMKSNNKPLVFSGTILGDIFLEQFCNSNEFDVKKTIITKDPFTLENSTELKKGCRATQYKLKDSIYEELKYIKENRGSISRF